MNSATICFLQAILILSLTRAEGTTNTTQFDDLTDALENKSAENFYSTTSVSQPQYTDASHSDDEVTTSSDFITLYPMLNSTTNQTFVAENVTAPLPDWIWDPVEWSGWLALQMVSSVIGIVGNLLVIIVLFERRSTGSSADALITNLAIADFLTSIFIVPIPRASRVPSTGLARFYCILIYTSTPLWLSIITSIFTLTAISVERFLAVVYPLQFVRLKTRRRITILILTLWALALLSNVPKLVNVKVDDISHGCRVKYTSPALQLAVGIVAFMVDFAVPSTIMLVTQVIAARSLQKQFKRFEGGGDHSNASSNLLVAKNKVLQMLFIVIFIFIICWGPNETAYFLYNLGVFPPDYHFGFVDQLLVLLAFYNSCLNPIVYTIRYPQFRTAIRRLLTCSQRSGDALFEYQPSTKTAISTDMTSVKSTV